MILLISVTMIGISTNDESLDEKTSNVYYTTISILLLFVSSALIALRTVIMKYFLAYGENQVNVSAFYNFYSFIQNVLILCVFIIDINNGFTFRLIDIILAQTTGMLWSIWSFIIAYVNLRGKAGTSDALIETWVIYQTMLDAAIFGRIPNTLQIISIFIGVSASIIIVLGYRK